jgi:3-deoxy-D-manno-octulosonic-acid transferase
MRRLTGVTLQQVSAIAAQSPRDAQRFAALGARPDRVTVVGNLKFEMGLPPDLRMQGQALRQGWGEQRPVFLAASTREGEEEPVVEAFRGILKRFPLALLILVPRHPARAPHALQLARSSGLSTAVYRAGLNAGGSTGLGSAAPLECLVVDVTGELLRFYAACDVAFVGGSLTRTGGHNMLEPAALSVPVLFGPHTFNFADISRELLAAGGAKRVLDAAGLEVSVCELLGDAALRQQMGAAGHAVVARGQGALAHTLDITDRLLAAGTAREATAEAD